MANLAAKLIRDRAAGLALKLGAHLAPDVKATFVLELSAVTHVQRITRYNIYSVQIWVMSGA